MSEYREANKLAIGYGEMSYRSHDIASRRSCPARFAGLIHLVHNLEKIGHGTFKVVAQLGDVSKVHAASAVVIQLG
jgi:hypothetical protein